MKATSELRDEYSNHLTEKLKGAQAMNVKRMCMVGVVAMFAAFGVGQPAALANEEIVMRSGTVNGLPGTIPTQSNVGPVDDNITYFTNGVGGALSPLAFAAADFAAADNGLPAELVVPHPFGGWIPSLPSDPDARWINWNHGQILANTGSGRPAASVLYAYDFEVTESDLSGMDASIDFHWAVDDLLGDPDGGANVIGVYINGMPLSADFRGPGRLSETSASQSGIVGLLNPAGTVNTLYVYQRDVGGSVSGIIFSATINICRLAGDKDDFASSGDSADAIVMRPEFGTWINRPGGNNDTFWGGVSLPFDVVQDAINWEFGYSFANLPPTICCPASLEIHFKASIVNPSTDSMHLQFSENPATFAWGYTMNNLNLLFGDGDGVWSSGEELTATLDLCELPLADEPPLNLLPRINADGFLDVHVQDDTGVDYIELCYNLCKCTDPPPDMVAWYTGDDCGPDDLLGNHDGIFIGTPFCPSNFKVGGGALGFFPGTYVEVPNAPGLNFGMGELTIDAWIRTTADGYRPIIENQPNNNPAPGYALRLQGGKLNFVVCDNMFTCGSVVSNRTVNDGNWHYVGATLSRGNTSDLLVVYIDGVPDGQTVVQSPALGSINSTADCLLIGAGQFCGPPGPTFFFDGPIDEIEIFSRALTDDEVLAIYRAGSAGKCKCVQPPPDMVAWWPLDETSGPIAHNIAGPDDGGHRCAVGFVPGKVGGAYRLTLAGPLAAPNQSYVTVNSPSPDLDLGSGSFTLDAWIYPEPCSLLHASNQPYCNPRPIVTKHSVATGYAFFVDEGSLGVTLNGAEFLSGLTPVVDNQWQHVAVTIDRSANRGTFFYDGVAIEVFGVPSSNVDTGTVPLRIGQSPSLLISNCNTPHCSANPSYYFNGLLDEIEIFKRALDEADILAIYGRGSHGKCKPDDGAPLETVVAFGLRNTILGQANLATDESGNLVVANFGFSGEDGVAIDVGEAQFLTIEFADLESMPEGATVLLDGNGTVGGLSEQPVSTLAVSKAGDNWILTPNFSASGSPPWQYQVFRANDPVGVIPGGEGTSVIASAAPGTIGCGGGTPGSIVAGDCGCGVAKPVGFRCDSPGHPNSGRHWVDWCLGGNTTRFPFDCPDQFGSPNGGWTPDPLPFGCGSSWNWWCVTAEQTLGTFARADGTGEVLIGDSVQIVILGGAEVSFPLTQLNITAGGLSSFSIGEEQLGIFGLPHEAEGQAHLAGLGGGARLNVANMRSSGEDGVTIDLGQTNGWDAKWLPIDPECVSEGASIELTVTGSIDGGPEQTVGTGSWTATADGSSAFWADFGPQGATTYSVKAYRNGELIEVLPNNPNGSMTAWAVGCPTPPADFHLHTHPYQHAITFDVTLVARAGGPTPFDEIRLVPDDPTATVSYVTSVTLLASGISEITLTDETVVVIESPVLATAPHDILKNRYISIDPGGANGINVGKNLDIRLTLVSTLVNGVTAVGSQWWANEADANCISIVSPSRPSVPPNWDACPTLHLTGCPIIPTSDYDIVAVDGQTGSDPPLAAHTQAKPGVKWHGDCVGFFTGTEWTAPNSQTSIDDAVAAIKTFQNPSALPGCPAPPCNATHTSVTDMVPNLTPGPQINKIVNIADVFSIILGFQGQEYPGPQIELCPDL